jgi:hypothetical protein
MWVASSFRSAGQHNASNRAGAALANSSYAHTMRRIVVVLLGAVLLVAGATRLAEVAGKR